jgi:hypothetical protein
MIHKKIDFTQYGGLPFNQGILRLMQESYAELSDAVAAIVGQNCVISGVQLNDADIWTDGWVVYNGELLPFLHATGDWFNVVNDTVSLTFADGLSRPVIVNRYATVNHDSSSNRRMDLEWVHYEYDLQEGLSYESPFERLRSFRELWNMMDAYRDYLLDLRSGRPVYQAVQQAPVPNGFVFSIPPYLNIDPANTKFVATIQLYSAESSINITHKISTVFYTAPLNTVQVNYSSAGISSTEFPNGFCELKIYRI